MDEGLFVPDKRALRKAGARAGGLVSPVLLVYGIYQDFTTSRPMPPPAKPRLTQTGNSNEQRRFEFIDKGRLRVSERSKRRNRSYVIDIIATDPKSRSTMRVPWHWLKLADVAAAVALVGPLVLKPGGTARILVLIGVGAVSVTALVMAIRGTGKKLVFVSCHAHLPLFAAGAGPA